MKPLYGLTKFLLIHPFGIEWKSGAAHVSILGTMHSLTLAIAYSIYHVMMAKRQMGFIEMDYNFVTHAINLYNLFSGCTFFLLIVITICVKQRQTINALRGIYNFDDQMEKMNFSVDNGNWSISFYLPGIIIFSALSVMEYENCIMFIRDSMAFSDFCLIMCYIPMFVLIVCEWMFIGYILAIKYRFCLINIQLQDLPEDDSHNQATLEVLKFNAKILTDATKALNSVFSFPLLLLLLNQFTAMATLLYDLCMCIVDFGDQSDKLLEDAFNTGGWSMLFMLETLALCRVCQALEMEAQKTTNHFVRLTKYGCLQIMQLRKAFCVKFIACHLFHIDMKLFYTMFGAIATYLIILVQFDIAQNG